MEFQVGWIADPLYFGDYPAVMRASQPHLPKFKEAEKKLLAGSVDFFALNFFTSHFVSAAPAGAPRSQVRDTCLIILQVRCYMVRWLCEQCLCHIPCSAAERKGA